MLIHNFLINSARKYPTKTALVCGEKRYSYGEIDSSTNKLAQALINLGLQPNDRVVIHLPNSFEAVLSIFGTLKASGVFVCINSTTKKDKLIYILNNCEASVLITTEKNAKNCEHLFQSVPSLKNVLLVGKDGSRITQSEKIFSFAEQIRNFPDIPVENKVTEEDLACLIYTSGSTGEPKGVISGHDNVVFATGSIIKYLENIPDDIVLNVLPLSFDYGLYQLLMTFRFGGTLVLERSFSYPASILKKMEKEKVTGFPGVPTIFAMLLQMNLDSFDLSSLRYITNTAAALPTDHILALKKRFHWVEIYSMYGLTECKRALYLPPDQLDRRPGSVGIPIPGTRAWIEDENGNKVRPHEVGELVVSGPHVMRGYWKDEETTKMYYRKSPNSDGIVLYTGDLFKTDEEGFFYFVSRKDDIIKSRGEKVSPKEIENVLYSINGVIEAAVVGVPDRILGQAIKAYVVSNNELLNEKDILKVCKSKLEDYMVPQFVEFRKKLPKTSTGKIDKKVLSATAR